MKQPEVSAARELLRDIGSLTLLLFLALLWAGVLSAQTKNAGKAVLVIYWDSKDFPGNVGFDQAFQAGLKNYQGGPIEYYAEYLDSNRFTGENQLELFRDYLRQKYAERKIDVVVVNPDPPLDFVLKYRTELFPNVPIVFLAVRQPPPAQLSAGAGITGLVLSSTHKETLDLALRLQPDIEQVFVISGTPDRDKRYEEKAHRALEGYPRIKINYLTDLPLDEVIARTQNLPERSILFWFWQQSADDHGRIVKSPETLGLLAKTSRHPIYAMNSAYVGHGALGGYVVDSGSNGDKIAQIVLKIFNGVRPQDLPVERAPSSPMFDWRELQRWGIDERRLPPGTVVSFRQFTFWERYKWRIVGVIALFLLQTSFIGVLLVERGRRRRAKESLDQLNAQLEQRIEVRTAALDRKSRELESFAYSVAHDLKAPLRGIDGYSRLLLDEHAKTLNDEGRSFLKTIQSSTEEMSQLIDDLLEYSRIERREMKQDHVELRSLVTTVVAQRRREAGNCQIDLAMNVNRASVIADSNGLVQSLRNYIDNAIKFTHGVPEPKIEVGARETSNSVVLWVRDNGIGFDMKYRDKIFEIFQRLNPGEDFPGTGIGLAVVRKSMERMGGHAWAESQPGKGATFYLEISKSSPEAPVDELQP